MWRAAVSLPYFGVQTLLAPRGYLSVQATKVGAELSRFYYDKSTIELHVASYASLDDLRRSFGSPGSVGNGLEFTSATIDGDRILRAGFYIVADGRPLVLFARLLSPGRVLICRTTSTMSAATDEFIERLNAIRRMLILAKTTEPATTGHRSSQVVVDFQRGVGFALPDGWYLLSDEGRVYKACQKNTCKAEIGFAAYPSSGLDDCRAFLEEAAAIPGVIGSSIHAVGQEALRLEASFRWSDIDYALGCLCAPVGPGFRLQVTAWGFTSNAQAMRGLLSGFATRLVQFDPQPDEPDARCEAPSQDSPRGQLDLFKQFAQRTTG